MFHGGEECSQHTCEGFNSPSVHSIIQSNKEITMAKSQDKRKETKKPKKPKKPKPTTTPKK